MLCILNVSKVSCDNVVFAAALSSDLEFVLDLGGLEL